MAKTSSASSSSTPSNSKKDGKKKPPPPTTPSPQDNNNNSNNESKDAQQDAQQDAHKDLRIPITFQSRSASASSSSTSSSNGDFVNPSKCLLPTSAMRSLSLVPGGLVVIETQRETRQRDKTDSETPVEVKYVVCRAWPSTKRAGQPAGGDRLLLHRLWQDNFDSDNESNNKKVVLSPMKSKNFRLLPAKSLLLMINDAKLFELKKSVELRHMIRAMVVDCVFQTTISLTLSFKGKIINMEVYHIVPTDRVLEKGLPLEVLKAFQINEDTEIVLVTSHEEAFPYFGIEPIDSGNLCLGNTKQLSADLAMKSLQQSFVGYEKEAKLALGIVLLGLGFLDSDNTHELSNVEQASIEVEKARANKLFSLPIGALICGPSGTGKSQLVKSIMDVLKCNSVQIDSKLLLSTYQGEAESQLRAKFQEAKSLSPCCIVVDNMDLILPSRSGSNVSDVQKRVVSSYLSLVDELHDSSGRVFILGTTTRPLDIDSAVRRSGRIDREIELPVPSSIDREKIVSFMCSKHGILVVDDDIDAHRIDAQSNLWIRSKTIRDGANRAHGMVASDLLQVLKEACYIQSSIMAQPSKPALKPASDDMVRNLLDDFSELSVDSPSLLRQTDSCYSSQSEISEITLFSAVQRIPPSALREVVVEVPTVRWTDIGGMESVKESLKQVVEWPLLHPEWFANMGIAPLKGVLLYGPPGCSKTLMAKAVATESSMNFLAVRGPELLSKWLGESEKAVQALFKKARAAAPSIVFFDEIDALAGVRGESSAGVSDRVLSQLLTELDGIQSRKQVIVIAATNRPDMLDPALIRPGRIDRKIYVPPPDDASREGILRLELGKMTLSGPFDFQELVRLTDGYSGAEVVALCNEAALFAIDRNADSLTSHDVTLAASKITPQITPKMIQFYTNFANKNR